GNASLELVSDPVRSEVATQLRSERSTLLAKRTKLQAKADKLIERALEATGALESALNAKYNGEVAPELERIESELNSLNDRLAEEQRRLAQSNQVVATERLLELVAQIKDPAGPKCRELLVPATHSVVYEVTRTGSSSLPRVEHRLTGTLTVGSGQAAVHI